jgi:hypothetical protein
MAFFEAVLLETSGLPVVLLAIRAFLVAVMLLISDFFSMLIVFSPQFDFLIVERLTFLPVARSIKYPDR